jgi:putative transposase
VPKHGRSFDGFDEQILALYAGGMTTRDIQRHLRELYGVDVSEGLISEVTGSIQGDVRAWQSRPLQELYVVVYLDAMLVAIRDQQVVRKKAVYVAVGVTLEGERDCLGLWIETSEGARFWTSVLTDLRNRGVKDVLFVCTDGLTGFPEAIDAVFPQASTRPASSTSSASRCATSPGRNEKLRRRAAPHLHRRRRRPSPPGARRAQPSLGEQQDPHRRARRLGPSLGARHSLPRFPRGDPADHLHDQQRREPAHAGPQNDQDPRTLPQRRRSAPTDLARDHARQNDLANLLQPDASDGSPTHPLRRPHPRPHLNQPPHTQKTRRLFLRPACASETTSCTPARPRSTRPRGKLRQNASVSASPTSSAITSR